MEGDPTEKSCHFCLNSFEDGQFVVLQNIKKDMLEVVCTGLDITLFNDLTICSSCDGLLETLFKFKTSCMENEDNLFNIMKPESENEELDLIKLVKYNIKLKSKGTPLLVQQNISDEQWDSIVNDYVNRQNIKVCRTCSGILSSSEVKEQFVIDQNRTLKASFRRCLPEVNLSFTKDPVLCPKCLHTVERHSKFLSLCSMAQVKLSQNLPYSPPNSPPSATDDDTNLQPRTSKRKRLRFAEDSDSDFDINEELPSEKSSDEKSDEEGEKRHKCQYCPHSTYFITDLRRHIMRLHFKQRVEENKLKRRKAAEKQDREHVSASAKGNNDIQHSTTIDLVDNDTDSCSITDVTLPSSQSNSKTNELQGQNNRTSCSLNEGIDNTVADLRRKIDKLLESGLVIDWASAGLNKQLLERSISAVKDRLVQKNNNAVERLGGQSDKRLTAHGQNGVNSKSSLVPNPACLSKMVKSQINNVDSQKSYTGSKVVASNNNSTNPPQKAPMDVNIVHNIHFHVNKSRGCLNTVSIPISETNNKKYEDDDNLIPTLTSPVVLNTNTKSDLILKQTSAAEKLFSMIPQKKQLTTHITSEHQTLNSTANTYLNKILSDDESALRKTTSKSKGINIVGTTTKKDKVSTDITKAPSELLNFGDTDEFLKKLCSYVNTDKRTVEPPHNDADKTDNDNFAKPPEKEPNSIVPEEDIEPDDYVFDEPIASDSDLESNENIPDPSDNIPDEAIASEILELEQTDEVIASEITELPIDTPSHVDPYFEFCDVSIPIDPDPLSIADPLDNSNLDTDMTANAENDSPGGSGDCDPFSQSNTSSDNMSSEKSISADKDSDLATNRLISTSVTGNCVVLLPRIDYTKYLRNSDSAETNTDIAEDSDSAETNTDIAEDLEPETLLQSENNAEIQTSKDNSEANQKAVIENTAEIETSKNNLDANLKPILSDSENGICNAQVDPLNCGESLNNNMLTEQLELEEAPDACDPKSIIEEFENMLTERLESEKVTDVDQSKSVIEECENMLTEQLESEGATDAHQPKSVIEECEALPEVNTVENENSDISITYNMSEPVMKGDMSQILSDRATNDCEEAESDPLGSNQHKTVEVVGVKSQTSELFDDVDISECNIKSSMEEHDEFVSETTGDTIENSLCITDVRSVGYMDFEELNIVDSGIIEHRGNIFNSIISVNNGNNVCVSDTKINLNIEGCNVETIKSELKIDVQEANIKEDEDTNCEQVLSKKRDGKMVLANVSIDKEEVDLKKDNKPDQISEYSSVNNQKIQSGNILATTKNGGEISSKNNVECTSSDVNLKNPVSRIFPSTEHQNNNPASEINIRDILESGPYVATLRGWCNKMLTNMNSDNSESNSSEKITLQDPSKQVPLVRTTETVHKQLVDAFTKSNDDSALQQSDIDRSKLKTPLQSRNGNSKAVISENEGRQGFDETCMEVSGPDNGPNLSAYEETGASSSHHLSQSRNDNVTNTLTKSSPRTNTPDELTVSPIKRTYARAKKKIVNNNCKITDHFKRADKQFSTEIRNETQNVVNPDTTEHKVPQEVSMEAQIDEHFSRSFLHYKNSQPSSDKSLHSDIPSGSQNTKNKKSPAQSRSSKPKRTVRKTRTSRRKKIDTIVISDSDDSDGETNPTEKRNTGNRSTRSNTRSTSRKVVKSSSTYQIPEIVGGSQATTNIDARDGALTQNVLNNSSVRNWRSNMRSVKDIEKALIGHMLHKTGIQKPITNNPNVGNKDYQPTDSLVRAFKTTVNINSGNTALNQNVLSNSMTQSPLEYNTNIDNLRYRTPESSQIGMNIESRNREALQGFNPNFGTLGFQSPSVNIEWRAPDVLNNTDVANNSNHSNLNYQNVESRRAPHVTMSDTLASSYIQSPSVNNPNRNYSYSQGVWTNGATEMQVNIDPRNSVTPQNIYSNINTQRSAVGSTNNVSNLGVGTIESNRNACMVGSTSTGMAHNVMQNTNVQRPVTSIYDRDINYQALSWDSTLNLRSSISNKLGNNRDTTENVLNTTAHRQSPLPMNTERHNLNYQSVDISRASQVMGNRPASQNVVSSKSSDVMLSSVQSSSTDIALDDITGLGNNDPMLSNFLSFLGHSGSRGSSSMNTKLDGSNMPGGNVQSGKDIIDGNENISGLLLKSKVEQKTESIGKLVPDIPSEQEVLFVNDDPEQMVIMNEDFEDEWVDVNETLEPVDLQTPSTSSTDRTLIIRETPNPENGQIVNNVIEQQRLDNIAELSANSSAVKDKIEEVVLRNQEILQKSAIRKEQVPLKKQHSDTHKNNRTVSSVVTTPSANDRTSSENVIVGSQNIGTIRNAINSSQNDNPNVVVNRQNVRNNIIVSSEKFGTNKTVIASGQYDRSDVFINYENITNVVDNRQNSANGIGGSGVNPDVQTQKVFNNRTENFIAPNMWTPAKCAICNFSTNNKSLFKLHMVNHQVKDRPTFKCSACGFWTPVYSTFETHMDNCQGAHARYAVTVRPPPDTREDVYTCNKCGYQTNYRSTYEDHVLKHKSFKCPRCDYNVCSVTEYEEHLKWHYMQSHGPV